MRSEFTMGLLYERSNVTCNVMRYIAAKAMAMPIMLSTDDAVYRRNRVRKFLIYMVCWLFVQNQYFVVSEVVV